MSLFFTLIILFFLNPVFSAQFIRYLETSLENDPQVQTNEASSQQDSQVQTNEAPPQQDSQVQTNEAPPQVNDQSESQQQNCSTPDLSTKPQKKECRRCWKERGEPVWDAQNCRWKQGRCVGSKPDRPQCTGEREYKGSFDHSTCQWQEADNNNCQSIRVCESNADCDSEQACQNNTCVTLADCIGGKVRNDQNKCVCSDNTLWDRLYKVCRESCPGIRPYYNARFQACCPNQTRQVMTYQGCLECARDSQCDRGQRCIGYKCVTLKPISTTVTPRSEVRLNTSRTSHPNSCSENTVLDFSYGYNKCCPADKPVLARGTYTSYIGIRCVECNEDVDCSGNQVCLKHGYRDPQTKIYSGPYICQDNPEDCPVEKKYKKEGQCFECLEDRHCSVPGHLNFNGQQTNGGTVCENNRCIKKGDCPLERPYMDEVTGQCCNRFYKKDEKRRCIVFCGEDKPYFMPGGCYGLDKTSLHDCGEEGFRMQSCVQCLGDPHCTGNKICNSNHECVDRTAVQEDVTADDVQTNEREPERGEGSSGLK